MKIVLASSSSYRKQLLSRIITDFDCFSPDIDESKRTKESFKGLAERLAIEKAQSHDKHYPDSLIIGSDQVACLNSTQLCKPATKTNTIKQLMACQGRTAHFYTGICVLNTRTGKTQSAVETYETRFRQLSEQQITNYVEREPAHDCAGGFKMEGLGIALFEKISGDDPNTLIGLPLIKLIEMLEKEGISVL